MPIGCIEITADNEYGKIEFPHTQSMFIVNEMIFDALMWLNCHSQIMQVTKIGACDFFFFFSEVLVFLSKQASFFHCQMWAATSKSNFKLYVAIIVTIIVHRRSR